MARGLPGSNIINTKLLVPSGGLLHENSGETLSPTQFGLFGWFALLLATLFGMILPSSKVVNFKLKILAELAAVAAKAQHSVANAGVSISRLLGMFFSLSDPPRLGR
jgi:hypothetical protein